MDRWVQPCKGWVGGRVGLEDIGWMEATIMYVTCYKAAM